MPKPPYEIHLVPRWLWLTGNGLVVAIVFILVLQTLSDMRQNEQIAELQLKVGASSTTDEPNSAGGSLRPAPAATEGTTQAPVSPHRSKAVSARPPSGAPAALFWAIRQKEGWDGARREGPAGERGPYQITKAYWEDACEWGKLDWDYEKHVQSRARCEYIMEIYWRRHGAKTDEERARQHNGGPAGPAHHSTEQYWNDVRNLMTVYSKENE